MVTDDLSVRHGDVWREPRRRSEIARYAAAAVAVLAGIAALGHGMAGQPPGPAALATDDVVMVDLAPAPPSSAPARDVEDGPEQPASVAVPVAPPASPDRPRAPPPPEAPDADDEAPKPKAPAPPPPAPAAVERAPSGTRAPVSDAPTEMSEDARQAEAHAVDRWQRAMAMRLEGTKRRLAHAVHTAGKAVVGFSIDRDGRLVGSRIVTSSGCVACDAVALELVAEASPYPVPPRALSEDGLSFTVPVRFNGRR